MSEKKDPPPSEPSRPAMFPSSLTIPNTTNGKQAPLDLANSKAGSSGSLPSYHQVSSSAASMLPQKGKLILPTALWILIIVAGLCFLSLMASLNKSMSTLDTLVELEQERARQESRLPLGENRNHHSKPERLSMEAEFDLDVNEADSDKAASWLALPPWLSLDPPRKAESELSIKQLSGLIDQFIQQSQPAPSKLSGAGSLTPIETIIIAEELPNSPRPPSSFAGFPLPFSSIQSQPPVFISSEPLGLRPMREQQIDPEVELLQMIDHVGEKQPARFDAIRQPQDQRSTPLIQANIEHVDIHLDSPQDDESGYQLKGEKQQQPLVKTRDELDLENIKKLENSIDSLLASLSESSAQTDVVEPLKPMFGQPELTGQKNFESSIMPMWMPVDSANILSESKPSPQSSNNSNPNEDVVALSFTSEFPSDSLETNAKPSSSNIKLSSQRTPYELDIADSSTPTQKSGMDQALNKLAEDLTQTLLEDMITNSLASQAEKDAKLDLADKLDESVMAKNVSSPVIVEESSSSPIENKKQVLTQAEELNTQRKGSDMEQLFKMFFGPPPGSKLAVMDD